jgi:hypothetical protein
VTIEGESRNVVDGRNAELGQVRYGIRRGYHQIPRTPLPDATRLLAAAVVRQTAALKWKTGAAANLQLAQVASQTDPGEEMNAALRAAHAALDAAEAAADLAAREVASYQVRVWQARVNEDDHD